jgi:hypothetical protein
VEGPFVGAEDQIAGYTIIQVRAEATMHSVFEVKSQGDGADLPRRIRSERGERGSISGCLVAGRTR